MFQSVLKEPRSSDGTETGAGAVIYFIQSEAGPIKIGFTNGDTAASAYGRVRTLQTGHPWPLRLVHATDGKGSTEKALHRRFAPYRMMGEWFHLSEEILAWIEADKVRLKQN
jgi:hypothetical protein